MSERDEAGEPRLESSERHLHVLYETTANFVVHFLDWRHKLILLASSTLALVFAITSWLYKQKLGGIVMSFPLFAGGAMAFVCRVLDRRNGMIIQACYDSAILIETAIINGPALSPKPRGLFELIRESRDEDVTYEPNPWTYGWVLRRVYGGLAIILLVLSVAALGLGIFAPELLKPDATPSSVPPPAAPVAGGA